MNTEAVCNFWAGPDRERDAALAWAFELTYYFKRGVGEAPVVTATPSWHEHRDGDVFDYKYGFRLNFWRDENYPAELTIYTVRGLMSTTHPLDRSPVTIFDEGYAWSLEDSMRPERRDLLRRLYREDPHRWDGRE